MAFGSPVRKTLDFLDIVKFNSVSGRFFKVDYDRDTRTKEDVDITDRPPTFAIDFLSMEVGYISYTKRGPDYRMVPLEAPYPAQPDDRDEKGNMLFKNGFRVKLFGRDLDGLREWSSTAICVNDAVEELYYKYKNSPEAATGKVPIVKLTRTIPIPGRGKAPTTYAPCFVISAWTDRPAVFGPATVPVPVMIQEAPTNIAQIHDAKLAATAKKGIVGVPTSKSDVYQPPHHDDLNDEIPF